MRKNNILIIIAILLQITITQAQEAAQAQPATATAAQPVSAQPAAKKVKKVTLSFEDELVSGKYDTPEIMLMNTRKNVKYKDLFNTRNNFIDEIELNRGFFNEHRK